MATTAPDELARWTQLIRDRVAADDDLRRAFERTPGKVALALGVPMPVLIELLAAWPTVVLPPDPGLGDVSSPDE